MLDNSKYFRALYGYPEFLYIFIRQMEAYEVIIP
jgi:hypothetical protein